MFIRSISFGLLWHALLVQIMRLKYGFVCECSSIKSAIVMNLVDRDKCLLMLIWSISYQSTEKCLCKALTLSLWHQ